MNTSELYVTYMYDSKYIECIVFVKNTQWAKLSAPPL